MKTILNLVVSLLFCSLAQAENTAFINFLGFSDNGNYMAFQEAIWVDGSGSYYSAIRILDVKKDAYVSSKVTELEDTETPNIPAFSSWVANQKTAAKSLLNTYKIKQSNGEALHISVAPRISGLVYKDKYISLSISEKAVNMANDKIIPAAQLQERFELCETFKDWNEAGLGPYPADKTLLGYTITAFSVSGTNDLFAPTTLHDDTRVPLSRYCPYAYSLNSAFAFKNKVVLMVSYNTYGFEGPDTQFITVPFDISAF